MIRYLMIALVAVALLGGAPRAHASEPYGCLVFEDDSFVCGTLGTAEDGSWTWDEDKPAISGCIPGGLCDTPYTDDCPPPLEDVACYDWQVDQGLLHPR